MKLFMNQTMRGSIDGVTVIEYEAGHEYELPEVLGTVFLQAGAAELVETETETPEKPTHVRRKK